MSTPEAGLRARILQTLRLDYPPSKGQVRIWGRPASGSTGAGHPDLFGVALGHPLALEVKMPKGKLSPQQEAKLHDLRECGTYAWAVRSEAEASRAVYHAKLGKRVPMPEEPIDFDDWFKTIVTDIPTAQVIDVTPREAAASAAVEAGADLVVDPEPVEGTFEAAEQTVTDVAGRPLDLDQPAPDLASVLGYGEDKDAEDVLSGSLQGDIRTVGDRVTEVWEVLGVLVTHTTAVATILKALTEEIAAHRQALAALLREVGLEEQAVEVEDRAVPDLPEIPTNGAAEAKPKPRGRRKRSEAS